MEASEHEHDTLQIITDSPIDSDKFQRVLHEAVNRDMAEFDRQIARNDRRLVWEIIMGVIFIALSIMLTIYLDKLLLTIVSMFGTMAVRDAIKIKTSLNNDINYLKKLLDPISNIKLEVIQSKESKEAL